MNYYRIDQVHKQLFSILESIIVEIPMGSQTEFDLCHKCLWGEIGQFVHIPSDFL